MQPKHMTDAEINTAIVNLERQIHTWGSMTIVTPKLERLRAEQNSRRQPVPEPPRVIPPKVRAQSLTRAFKETEGLIHCLDSVSLMLAQAGVKHGYVEDMMGMAVRLQKDLRRRLEGQEGQNSV